jgi:hypothetical protein
LHHIHPPTSSPHILPFPIGTNLPDHNTIKLELNNKRNSIKYSNTWRLNNTLHHDQWVIKGGREEIKKFQELSKNESRTY